MMDPHLFVLRQFGVVNLTYLSQFCSVIHMMDTHPFLLLQLGVVNLMYLSQFCSVINMTDPHLFILLQFGVVNLTYLSQFCSVIRVLNGVLRLAFRRQHTGGRRKHRPSSLVRACNSLCNQHVVQPQELGIRRLFLLCIPDVEHLGQKKGCSLKNRRIRALLNLPYSSNSMEVITRCSQTCWFQSALITHLLKNLYTWFIRNVLNVMNPCVSMLTQTGKSLLLYRKHVHIYVFFQCLVLLQILWSSTSSGVELEIGLTKCSIVIIFTGENSNIV